MSNEQGNDQLDRTRNPLEFANDKLNDVWAGGVNLVTGGGESEKEKKAKEEAEFEGEKAKEDAKGYLDTFKDAMEGAYDASKGLVTSAKEAVVGKAESKGTEEKKGPLDEVSESMGVAMEGTKDKVKETFGKEQEKGYLDRMAEKMSEPFEKIKEDTGPTKGEEGRFNVTVLGDEMADSLGGAKTIVEYANEHADDKGGTVKDEVKVQLSKGMDKMGEEVEDAIFKAKSVARHAEEAVKGRGYRPVDTARQTAESTGQSLETLIDKVHELRGR